MSVSVRIFEAYLIFFIFCAQLLIGSMGMLMIHALTGGEWGKALSPSLTKLLRFAPLLFLLFFPIMLGARSLYPWMGAAHVSSYLNFTFFTIRAILYLSLWIYLAKKLRVIQSRSETTSRDRYFCAASLLLLAYSATFASIDWMMSREAPWSSSTYGFIFIAGALSSALAYGIFTATHNPALKKKVLRDLANLSLTVIMLWAYVSFMQFLIMWSGNLPDEVSWYVRRSSEGWLPIVQALAVFGFFLPFGFLLFVRIKESPFAMALLAALLLFTRFLDIFWLVLPSSRPQFMFSLFDLAILIILGAGLYQLRIYTRGDLVG